MLATASGVRDEQSCTVLSRRVRNTAGRGFPSGIRDSIETSGFVRRDRRPIAPMTTGPALVESSC
jgi:hypothetical protein